VRVIRARLARPAKPTFARRTARPVGAAVALVLAVSGLAACSSSGDDSHESTAPAPAVTTPPSGSPTDAAGAGAPKGFEGYYAQQIHWTRCDSSYRCATVEAPTSWQDASSAPIRLSLKMLPASGKRRGALLTNPGGPGASGVDFVDQAKDMFGKDVLAAYDVVGFDPRGVGTSTPVTCLGDKQKDAQLSRWYPDTTAGLASELADATAWAGACKANTGPLLGHVDTQSVARDLDMLRADLGETKLDYLGFSYGTQIGGTYAGLFPDRVGRMVLDGAIDPTLSAEQTTEQQAVGFEDALRAYVQDCESGSGCPLSGGVDGGMGQIRALFAHTEVSPLPTGDKARPLTATLAFYGVAVTLYSKDSWKYLTLGLKEALDSGTGSILLSLADSYNSRNADGTFQDNSAEAFRAVGCLDDPGTSSMAAMKAQAVDIEAKAPTVGQFFTYGGLACKPWPYPQVKQDFDVHAKGAPPIVVVGTTRDPATPYSWAQGLASTLGSGVLVTYEGDGHTAYRRDNTCIANAVGAFLVDDKVPAAGTTCS
jgi:pimeloyl-ACP methyl ester carboxylesterase